MRACAKNIIQQAKLWSHHSPHETHGQCNYTATQHRPLKHVNHTPQSFTFTHQHHINQHHSNRSQSSSTDSSRRKGQSSPSHILKCIHHSFAHLSSPHHVRPPRRHIAIFPQAKAWGDISSGGPILPDEDLPTLLHKLLHRPRGHPPRSKVLLHFCSSHDAG